MFIHHRTLCVGSLFFSFFFLPQTRCAALSKASCLGLHKKLLASSVSLIWSSVCPQASFSHPCGSYIHVVCVHVCVCVCVCVCVHAHNFMNEDYREM